MSFVHSFRVGINVALHIRAILLLPTIKPSGVLYSLGLVSLQMFKRHHFADGNMPPPHTLTRQAVTTTK